MTQEEKDLLLQDLCARLPYGVKYKDAHGYKETIYIWSPGFHTALNTILCDGKPSLYLRPMSSMTKEEYEEFKKLDKRSMHRCRVLGNEDLWFDRWEIIDFFNKHHIDYRGLIFMGLVLEAPEGMYK